MIPDVLQEQIDSILDLIEESNKTIEQLKNEMATEKDKQKKYNKVLLALRELN
ncbi:MAG: hypothetical protein PHY47_12775 [Lachnospiraceae bacterium]|nr:hypothetical protein [Lachnospiraceae bacterium]